MILMLYPQKKPDFHKVRASTWLSQVDEPHSGSTATEVITKLGVAASESPSPNLHPRGITEHWPHGEPGMDGFYNVFIA